jgi:hypothetical protein
MELSSEKANSAKMGGDSDRAATPEAGFAQSAAASAREAGRGEGGSRVAGRGDLALGEVQPSAPPGVARPVTGRYAPQRTQRLGRA